MSTTDREHVQEKQVEHTSAFDDLWRRMAPMQRRRAGRTSGPKRNVGQGERLISLAAGSILTLLGLARRDLKGMLIGGAGGGLLWRGITGHCSVYEAVGADTADHGDTLARRGIHVVETCLINKSPEELYGYWCNFENLPRFMTHLKSVRAAGERRTHWVARAPSIVGGQVEWEAETTADEPNSRLEWRSLPGADVEHRGSVLFERAPGERGTTVRVAMVYSPPFGRAGKWTAKLFGEEPEQQIRDDLRNFKRLMETGELPTTAGQPRGKCSML